MPPNPSNNLDIQATQFSPSDDSGKGQKFSKRQIVLGLLSAFVIATLWFLFTSKSVQIRLSPAAQSVSISGGFSIALGGIYLLRQGSYKIEAVSELHEPLEMRFDVDERRNQLDGIPVHPVARLYDIYHCTRRCPRRYQWSQSKHQWTADAGGRAASRDDSPPAISDLAGDRKYHGQKKYIRRSRSTLPPTGLRWGHQHAIRRRNFHRR